MSEQSPLSLGTEDIKKLLMRYAVPAIVAMTAASLYNMMDSIFIGHGVGALGIAGLAVTFPFINLAAAFGSLVGVGASTLVSVKMGQKDLKSAEAVLGNVLLLNTVIGFLLTKNRSRYSAKVHSRAPPRHFSNPFVPSSQTPV